jgi:hypothetical protein
MATGTVKPDEDLQRGNVDILFGRPNISPANGAATLSLSRTLL